MPAAYIAEGVEPSGDDYDDDDNLSGKLYNMFEVFTAEKKRETRSSKLTEAIPVPPPSLVPLPPPKLTNELRIWLLESKLAQTTPTHAFFSLGTTLHTRTPSSTISTT